MIGRDLSVWDVVLTVLGVFYVIAGFMTVRAAAMSAFLDEALARLSMKPTPRAERLRFIWFICSSIVVFLGGLLLMFRTEAALWLFVLSALGQAIYLYVLAPRSFDVVDAPDPKGRSQTTNAFYIYLIVTAGIAVAASSGRLRDVMMLSQVEIVLAGIVCSVFVWFVWHILWRRAGDGVA